MKPKKRTYPEEGKKNPETPANKDTQGEGEKPGAAPAQEGKTVGKLTDKKRTCEKCGYTADDESDENYPIIFTNNDARPHEKKRYIICLECIKQKAPAGPVKDLTSFFESI